MKQSMPKLFTFALTFALIVSFLPAQAFPVGAVSPNIIISQVYGGGGNSGATYKNDFIELFNLGSTSVSLNGWSVQYASATGSTWTVTNLTNVSLLPGQYYLVQEAAGTGGTTALPTPDAIGTTAMSATAGKVALVSSTTALSGSCPTGGSVIDFIGFGSTANCSESTVAPAPSNTTADIRALSGCTETDNNSTDFATGTPIPRNTSTTFHYCSGPTAPTGLGTATPNTLMAGDSTLLTMLVTPGVNPPTTGHSVTCDLSPIGGSASQAFVDNGDNNFSYSTTVTSGISSGSKSLACTINDAESRSGSASINLTVTAYVPLAGTIVISQVYGGGGNSGAIYKNDFIELFNRGTVTIDLGGWSVQYASAAGTSWQVTILSGSIAPGKYYLVQEAAGSGGTVDLPTPDASGTIKMSATDAKVALVNNSTGLSGSCPTGSNISDFVGYGSANCSETSPAPGLSNTTADLRKSDGAQDTDDNSADFVAGAPNPRNSMFPFAAVGLAIPNAVFTSDSSLLTVAVTPGDTPPSTGITTTCDLTAIGGAASQSFFDNGTHGDVTASDNIFSYLATVPSDISGGTKSLLCTVNDEQTRTVTATISLTITAILPIGTVQGSVGDSDDGATFASPYAGQTVTIQGVIYENLLSQTSSGSSSHAFFVQNTTATADDDSNSSDGIYVYIGSFSTLRIQGGGYYTPKVGDEVILQGPISEYYNMTEIGNPYLFEVVRSNVVLDDEVLAFDVKPPDDLADANRYWERHEGMRGRIPTGSIVLGGRNVFSPSDAEVWVARSDSTIGLRTTDYTNRAFRDAHPLDDNYDPAAWDGNGYRILMGSYGVKMDLNDATALIAPARTFDTLHAPAIGGLYFDFDKYSIEPDQQITIDEGDDPALNNPPTSFDGSLNYSIVDYNLENLYDYRDNPFSGCDFSSDTAGCSNEGTPFLSPVSSPYDYVPASDAAYQSRLNDISLQIIDDLHSPDILMVQEVENQDICKVSGGAMVCSLADNSDADGKPDVLQDLALKVAENGGPAYDAAFDPDSSDLRGIAPAFLFRTDRVELLPAAGDPVLGTTPVIGSYTSVPYDSDVSNPKTLNAVLPDDVTACETNWVFPRAPDVGLFRIHRADIGDANYQDVYVIDNHFKSGPDSCVGHRTEQAKYNAALVAFIQAVNPDARIVVGGDLNVYPRPDDPFAPIGQAGSSDQLGSLYDPSLGLQNLWEVLLDQAPEAAYSYVYLGQAQTLDQMFINQKMLESLKQFRIAHINSDFPADFPAPGDVARGTSDHDPNVATFKWEPATVTFDSENPAALQVSAPGGSLNAGELTLKVYVTSTVGDINNAGLIVSLSPLAGGPSLIFNNCTSSVLGDTKTFTCTNSDSSIPVGTYDVTATVTGAYFAGEGYDAFTVYDPSLGYATGGGWFYWPGTTDKTTFGFVMKYNKSAKNLQGTLVLIRHLADGTVVRLKSNALTALAIQTDGGIATFSGKATYMLWDAAAGAYVTSGGNPFTVYAKDGNNPGDGFDYFWIRSVDNLVMDDPAGSNAVILGGGNIVVPHTSGNSK